ncbi:MAG: hypothetical protein Tsb0034_17730 [Ekhidna sp.]
MVHKVLSGITAAIRVRWVLSLKRLAFLLLPKTSAYQKFAILCTARSGSTWLHTLINSHINLHSEGETVLANHRSKIPKPFHQFAYQPYPGFIKAVGLKVFYASPVYRESLQAVLADKQVKLVWLFREDRLAQFVSFKRAQMTREWSHQGATEQKIRFEINEFEDFREHQKRADEALSRALEGRECFKLFYEQLQDQADDVLHQLQLFLEVKPQKLHSLLKKQSSYNIASQVSNWEEVESYIKSV